MLRGFGFGLAALGVRVGFGWVFGLVVFSVGVVLVFGRVSCFRLVAIEMSGWYLLVLTSSCFGLSVVCLCVAASGGFGWRCECDVM